MLMRIGEKLTGMLAERGIKQTAFAEAIGVSQGTVSRWLNNKQEPEYDALRAIADYFEMSVENLTQDTESSSGMVVDGIRVIGHVAAGEWREAFEWPYDEQYSIGLHSDRRYPNMRQFALEVRGPSMNKRYPPGSIVVCVYMDDLGREAITGERVVACRQRENFFEATVKEFQRDKDGNVVLWPSSTDPNFQTPIRLDDDDNAKIIGLVIGSYKPE